MIKKYVKSVDLFPENRIAEQDVQRAAAEDGGGAVEEGGQHQENLSLPGCGGHQGDSLKYKTPGIIDI